MKQKSSEILDVPSWVTPAALTAAAAGALATAIGLIAGNTDQVWWMLAVNFVYWTGLAQGMVVWSAMMRACQATWAAGIHRLAQSAAGFLPFSLLLFFVLFLGREHWLPWVAHPVEAKKDWLNAPFFFIRNFAGLALMAVLSAVYVKMATGDNSDDAAQGRLNRFSIILLLAYATVYTMIAIDVIMSLEPHWYSTMFAPYYFIGNQYASVAALIVFSALLREPFGLQKHINSDRFSDLGNLMMGFGMFFTGIMFAQWLTIWYANIPEEVSYIVPRYYRMPWQGVFILLFAILWLGPFFALQSHAVKRSPMKLTVVAAMVIIGCFLDKWLLIVPAFSKDRFAGLTPLAWGIPVMCLGVLVLAVVSALVRKPDVSKMDLALRLE